jgi:protoheme IX farnesyltransferase
LTPLVEVGAGRRTRSADPRGLPRLVAYYELTKPGITAFVVITAGVSFYLASRGSPAFVPLLHTLFGTLLGTGGALALNQYVERDVDARMQRTRTRPLPSGRMAPRDALAFGALLLAVGVGYLWALVGWLPALLTAGSAASYLWVYTPLKSRSYLATLVGAVPGAIPALIGWTAATGRLQLGAWVLFAIAFLWQLPHVLALAWMLKEDYERVGFFMSPPTDASGVRIGRHMMFHTFSLIIVSVFPTILGLTGFVYFVGAVVLGGLLLAAAMGAASEMTRPRARRVFFGSLLYQPLLLALMLLDVVRV